MINKTIRVLGVLIAILASLLSRSQNNFVCTNAQAEQVMLGQYNPSAYLSSHPITHPDSVSRLLRKLVSADSLKTYLLKLGTFYTRNSGSDTISAVKGIGAARTWIYHKFQQFSQQNQNRLLTSYLRFDTAICSINRHKDVFAVLPGSDSSYKDFILVEGHFDSRCTGLCDTACLAQGMEDNASGTALVMELARVMSRFSFRRTIVFMATTAEEQGLIGANAFAKYAHQKKMQLRCVMNNDIVGGVICGNTSSFPGCKPPGSIDSTTVRLFSFGSYNSPHKQLARFIKLEYQQLIRPSAKVTMSLSIQTGEDRSLRSGDHIPFRQNNYTAMRFTSKNECGDASNGVGYTDRQHTSGDVLGVDTDSDSQVDSFFVDFNYLARNTVINGNAAAIAAMGPTTPSFSISSISGDVFVNIVGARQYQTYCLGVRTSYNDWDSVYYVSAGPDFSVTLPSQYYIFSVAAVDSVGSESLFSEEQTLTVDGIQETQIGKLALMANVPNPFDEATAIIVHLLTPLKETNGKIVVKDMQGRVVSELPIALKQGANEVEFRHGYHASGTFVYSLVVDGRVLASGKMVCTN